MDRYTPRKLRPLAMTSMILRGTIMLLEYWPILLIGGLFFSPLQPYLLTNYDYYTLGSRKVKTNCSYLGLRGFIKYSEGSNCPAIVILNSKNHPL